MIPLLIVLGLAGLLFLALALALVSINKARRCTRSVCRCGHCVQFHGEFHHTWPREKIIDRAPCYGGAPFFSNEECN